MDTLQQIQDDEYTFPYHYVSQFRDRFTQCYYDSWGINYVSTIEYILKILAGEDFEKLIDIGCGDGRLVYEIQRRFPTKSSIGIDYSARAISLAKSMNPEGCYKQVNIIDQSMDQVYDFAVLMEVFEHINPENSAVFVQSVRKLVSPKGKLLVTVPHFNKPVEYKHYRHFSGQSLVECFQDHFNVENIIPFEKGKLRKSIIDTILGNRLFILNSGRIKDQLYRYYKRNLFHCREEDCNRLLVKFIAK